ncbi:restriction endonuclease subunit S [Vibrio splendidus]
MVPNGWEVKPLSSITKWSSGGTPSKSNPDYWSGEIPWISAASMRGHYFNKSELKITDLAVSNGAKMAPKDSLLLLVRGSMLWNKIPVGIAARRVSFNQDVKCLIPHADELTTEFLLYWFLTYEHRLMNMVTGTGIGAGKLDTTDLQGLDVFLPPLPEQRKISKILSAWDKAIATTEKLIETSKQQKKALMQQLLTGGKRLVDPETGKVFEEEWEEVNVGSIANLTAGGTPSTKHPEYWGGYILWMNSGEINLKQIFSVEGRITQLGLEKSNTKEIPSNSVLIALAGQGKTRGTVAINRIPLCTNQSIAALIPDREKVCSEFLYFNLDSRYQELRSMSTGDGGRGGLNLSILRSIKLRTPTIPEQKKIASVLTAADKEIEELKTKLVHLKQEKKALMQQLLTGKRRVKID